MKVQQVVVVVGLVGLGLVGLAGANAEPPITRVVCEEKPRMLTPAQYASSLQDRMNQHVAEGRTHFDLNGPVLCAW